MLRQSEVITAVICLAKEARRGSVSMEEVMAFFETDLAECHLHFLYLRLLLLRCYPYTVGTFTIRDNLGELLGERLVDCNLDPTPRGETLTNHILQEDVVRRWDMLHGLGQALAYNSPLNAPTLPVR